MEEYRIKSEKLAEMRRKMKEDVSSWYVKAAADDTLDEEMKKRAKRKKETEKKVRDEQSESDEDESHHSDEEDPKDVFLFLMCIYLLLLTISSYSHVQRKSAKQILLVRVLPTTKTKLRKRHEKENLVKPTRALKLLKTLMKNR